MHEWWTKATPADLAARRRAVAYYRHSAEIGQENSVEIQQDNIRKFAEAHGIEVIHEFADRGKSGLNAEGRPAFNEMMGWVNTRTDFQLVLVLDVSRWGRFQDTDLSAHYESLCTQHGKQVVYTNIGFTREGEGLINQLRKSIDRYQSAEYSRTLSKKVFEGAAKVAKQGYRPGASPPFGMYRMMLDENKQPDRILQPGQRKAIQNGRVILVPGDKKQVEVVQEIFVLFAEKGHDERQIAGVLNERNILSPGGRQWSECSVRNILGNQQYAGAVVYNKTSQRLKTRTKHNPRDQWVITPGAYEALVDPDLYEKTQSILDGRKRRYDREEMLRRLRTVYEKYGMVTSRLVRVTEDCPAPETYASKFGGLTGAFQAMYGEVLQKAKDQVFKAISKDVRTVTEYEDFLVINQDFTVLIQPSVPVPYGYGAYWTFWPDHRPVIDITLGVPLSDTERYEILGYLALPRMMVPEGWVRLSCSTDNRIEMHGHRGLDLIRELVQ